MWKMEVDVGKVYIIKSSLDFIRWCNNGIVTKKLIHHFSGWSCLHVIILCSESYKCKKKSQFVDS